MRRPARQKAAAMNTRTPTETLTAAQLVASARRATSRLARLRDQDPRGLAAAAAIVRADLIMEWPAVSSRALAVAMLASAVVATLAGITEIPARIQAVLPGHTGQARTLLELTAGGPGPARLPAPITRDEDGLSSAAALLTLAALACPARPRPNHPWPDRLGLL